MSFQPSSSDDNTRAVSSSFWGAEKEKKNFKVKNKKFCEGQMMLQSQVQWRKVWLEEGGMAEYSSELMLWLEGASGQRAMELVNG